jgi:hypothetical protein
VALRKLMCEVSDKFEKERKGKPAWKQIWK